MKIAIDGTFKGKSIDEKRANNFNKKKLPKIDYLFLVPFRHNTNNILSYNGDGSIPRGVTLPDTIKKWMKSELGAKKVKSSYYLGSLFKNPRKQILSLGQEVKKGQKSVVLYVDMDYIDHDKFKDKKEKQSQIDVNNNDNFKSKVTSRSGHGDHFVVLNDAKAKGQGKVVLNLYSWGTTRNVVLTNKQLKSFIWKIIEGTLP